MGGWTLGKSLGPCLLSPCLLQRPWPHWHCLGELGKGPVYPTREGPAAAAKSPRRKQNAPQQPRRSQSLSPPHMLDTLFHTQVPSVVEALTPSRSPGPLAQHSGMLAQGTDPVPGYSCPKAWMKERGAGGRTLGPLDNGGSEAPGKTQNVSIDNMVQLPGPETRQHVLWAAALCRKVQDGGCPAYLGRGRTWGRGVPGEGTAALWGALRRVLSGGALGHSF